MELTEVNKANNVKEANKVIHVKRFNMSLGGNEKTASEEFRSSPEDDLTLKRTLIITLLLIAGMELNPGNPGPQLCVVCGRGSGQ